MKYRLLQHCITSHTQITDTTTIAMTTVTVGRTMATTCSDEYFPSLLLLLLLLVDCSFSVTVGVHTVAVYTVAVYTVGVHTVGVYPVEVYPVEVYPVGVYPVGVYTVEVYRVGVYTVGVYTLPANVCYRQWVMS